MIVLNWMFVSIIHWMFAKQVLHDFSICRFDQNAYSIRITFILYLKIVSCSNIVAAPFLSIKNSSKDHSVFVPVNCDILLFYVSPV